MQELKATKVTSPAAGKAAGLGQQQRRPAAGGSAAAAHLPPPSIALPLTTSFLILLAFSGLTSSEMPPQARPQAGSPGSGNAVLAYAHNYFHTSSSSEPSSPHLKLLAVFLESILPQGEPPPTPVVPPALSAAALAIMLEMWLSDEDMPLPTAPAADSSRLGLSRPVEKRSESGAVSLYVAPLLLRTRCIKVCCRCLRARNHMRAVATHLPRCAAHLQALAAHIYIKAAGGSKSIRRQATRVPEPAQEQDAWLPIESVRVSASVSGFVFHAPIHAGNPKLGLAVILGAAASPAVQNVAAHVYRYVRRAFLLWPTGQSKDALAEVIDLWLLVCFPWQLSNPDNR